MKELAGFEVSEFASDGLEKAVYKAGSGPAVILIHELPGMSLPCIDLGRRLVAEGYTVYMPLLFGDPGGYYGLTPVLWGCVRREFNLLSTRAESPLSDWMRSLARKAHAECGGKGVGAIGMCLTGSFALSMMLEPALIAPVLSQPSLPMLPWKRADPGVSDREWENAKRRCREEGVPVLAFRFKGDLACTRARFENLREGLGDGFRAVELDGNKHAVLTYHFKDLSKEEQERVWGELRGFLKSALYPSPPPEIGRRERG